MASGVFDVARIPITSFLLKGLYADRSSPSKEGRYYWATDTDEIWRDTGSAWEQVMQSVGLKAGDYFTTLVGISSSATGRAALLDKLDALISSRQATIAALIEARAAKLDYLDAAILSRQATLTRALGVVPGDKVQLTNATERICTVTTYTKYKEITLSINGKIRTYFEIKHDTGAAAIYGRVYKNAAAVGTERSTSSLTYLAYTEDLPFTLNDLYQI